MTRPTAEYEEVLRLIAWGVNDCQISRLTGIPRGTIRDWRHGKRKSLETETRAANCPFHAGHLRDRRAYSYLLGLYLGDGYIVRMPRTYRLRVFLDLKYPLIIQQCAAAIATVRGRMPGSLDRLGCIEVSSYWNHWPCLFPQHGPGMKHERDVSLKPWQQEIADAYPIELLRGLIHSDGSRDFNHVKGKDYPRYQFANNSNDIHEVFRRTCEVVGVHWTQPWWKTVAVSRRPDVEKLDRFIGPKA